MNFNLDPKTTRAVLITGVIVFTLLLVSNFLTTRYTVKQTIAEVLPTVLPEAFEQIGLVARPTNPPIPTVTPKVRFTPTASPSLTATMPITVTSTPTVTSIPGVTSTPVTMGCDETQWHEPMDIPGCHHHHGFDPRFEQFKAIFNIDGFDLDAWLDKHGELLQPAWSTFQENLVGAIWLYKDAGPTGCLKDFEGIDPNIGDAFDCITHVLYRIHDVGTLDHLVNRFHSEAFIIRACTEGANGQATTQCGIAAGGAQPDYGVLFTPYKKDICHIPTEPGYPNYPDDELDQPSYRTSQIDPPRDGFIQQYWVNSDLNPIVKQYYPTGTNWLFNSAWLGMDLWQIFPVDLVCDKSPTLSIDTIKALLASVPPTLTENRHVTFKINDITLRAHPPGPFEGSFDPYGGACDEADNVCLPLFISANFPDKPVTLHEGAEPSECGPDVENPCIVFEFDVDTIFPMDDK